MRRLLLITTLLIVALDLAGCVSVTAKVCTEIPDMLKDRVPSWVPKDGCPIDFRFENLMPAAEREP